jgi:hypothetical protein
MYPYLQKTIVVTYPPLILAPELAVGDEPLHHIHQGIHAHIKKFSH